MKHFIFIIVLCGVFFSHTTYIIAPFVTHETVEQKLHKVFGIKFEIAKAVFMAESSMNNEAKNYNCLYPVKQKDGTTKLKSTFCKKEDKEKAWSVDCGPAQINVKGKICPKKLMTLEGSIPTIEKIYKTQGLNAWVAYKTGSYKKYMVNL